MTQKPLLLTTTSVGANSIYPQSPALSSEFMVN